VIEPPAVASARSAPADPRYKPSSLHAVPQLLRRFPPRPVRASWDTTRVSRGAVIGRVLAQPLVATDRHEQSRQHRALKAVLNWLAEFPGPTWQDRFLASTNAFADNLDWKHAAAQWWSTTRPEPVTVKSSINVIAIGLTSMICADVLRPPADWLMRPRTPKNLAAHLERVRDPDGWAALRAHCDADPASRATKTAALCRIAVIMAAKGGTIADITVGDCLELLQIIQRLGGGKTTSGYFYHLLHAIGAFPADAPPTVRVFGTTGQSSVEQLIDRYGLHCRPVRDLLVDYLRERQSTVDYVTLQRLAATLGKHFWADLEHRHPGIDSLRLAPEVAAAWKQRVLARESGLSALATVRAFYLDIAQWAMQEPTRWGLWAAPCPIRGDEMSRTKTLRRRKSRMDQRTRERLPVLPSLIAAVNTERRTTAELLRVAQATEPGRTFTAAGQTLRRTRLAAREGGTKTWAEDPETGSRRDLTFEEHQAFWAWAVVEVLRHTGLRIEELCELSHHSFVQYTLPSSGELLPLLHVAPSKTDCERLLPID
jgi:hypothetical protein